jgi:hypothetical protein
VVALFRIRSYSYSGDLIYALTMRPMTEEVNSLMLWDESRNISQSVKQKSFSIESASSDHFHSVPLVLPLLSFCLYAGERVMVRFPAREHEGGSYMWSSFSAPSGAGHVFGKSEVERF